MDPIHNSTGKRRKSGRVESGYGNVTVEPTLSALTCPVSRFIIIMIEGRGSTVSQQHNDCTYTQEMRNLQDNDHLGVASGRDLSRRMR